MPSVIFFGNERLATAVTTTAPTLRAIIAAGYQVAAVVSHNEATQSRKPRPLEIAEVAAQYSIPLLLPEKPADISEQLRGYQADIGVLAAYGKIVPQSVIDIFPHGIINVHPSLLPQHRGPIPLEAVIRDGAAETGVSIMGLVKAMDAGPIFAQQSVTLDGDETKQGLADLLGALGSELALQVLSAVFDGTAAPTAQDEAQATYDDRLHKGLSELDFGRSAVELEHQIRAYLGWPGSRTTIAAKDIVITKAHVIPGNNRPGALWRDGNHFGFYTNDGVLVVEMLKPAGKAEMTAAAFLAGYGQSLRAS